MGKDTGVSVECTWQRSLRFQRICGLMPRPHEGIHRDRVHVRLAPVRHRHRPPTEPHRVFRRLKCVNLPGVRAACGVPWVSPDSKQSNTPTTPGARTPPSAISPDHERQRRNRAPGRARQDGLYRARLDRIADHRNNQPNQSSTHPPDAARRHLRQQRPQTGSPHRVCDRAFAAALPQRFLICVVRCAQQSHTLAFREPTLNLTAAPPHSARACTPEPHRLREVATLDPAPQGGPGKTDHIQHIFGSQD